MVGILRGNSFFASSSSFALVSASSLFYGDEIGHRLRAMAEAQRDDPPEDSARALRRREKNNSVRGSQVVARGRRG